MNRRTFLAGSAALAVASPQIARAAAPATPRSWLDRWLAAFNAADLVTYAAFVKTHLPGLLPYLDDDLGLREATGGFDLLRAELTGPGEITAWFRDRHWDRHSRVVLTTAQEKIADLTFLGAPSPPGFAITRLDETAAVERLDAKLRRAAEAGRFSGTVLVSRRDTAVFRGDYGLADIARNIAVGADTRFCIGSMGKMFTAVAVLQLVQRGRLALSQPIARWIPDYPNAGMARQVTIEQLLMHTGGTGDFFGPEYEARAKALRKPDDFVRLFGARDPIFPPGSRFGYSNYGFMLLGALVERASDRPWDDYLHRHIFEPASMTSTSALPTGDGRTSVPYTGASTTGLKPLPFYVGLPAGGGYSTADDLRNFGRALRAGRLLDPKHRDLLTTGWVAARDGHWSAGLKVARRGGASFYGHAGSAPGISADYASFAASGYETIVLANRGHPQALNVAEFIGCRLPDAPAS